jgi:hypothetical protein
VLVGPGPVFVGEELDEVEDELEVLVGGLELEVDVEGEELEAELEVEDELGGAELVELD